MTTASLLLSRVSMGLTVSRETPKKLAVSRENEKKITVNREYFL